MDEPESRVAGRRRLRQLGGAVRSPVVDDDHLDVTDRLSADRRDAGGDVRLDPVDGDHDAQQRARLRLRALTPGPPTLPHGGECSEPASPRVTAMAGSSTHERRSGARLGLAPSHPSSHGSLELDLETVDDVVVWAEPEVGFLHRGTEKLFEVRDYRQLLSLANRHDWLSAFGNELGAALVVESMLGIEVPTRARWIRTLMAELSRLVSHLAFVVALGEDGHSVVPAPAALTARQTLQALMEEATGGRVHFMFNRIGGLREELPDGWLDRCQAALTQVSGMLPQIAAEVLSDRIRARGEGLGVLPVGLAREMGVSGPAARASGLDLDLRRDSPYLAYASLADRMRVPLRSAGDVVARFEVLTDELAVSIDLAEGCLERLERSGGPIDVRLPKVVKLPEGSSYVWSEAPSGITGYYLVSTGDKVPWRFKVRAPSFSNVATLSHVLPGTEVSDLGLVLASLFYVVGDIDR